MPRFLDRLPLYSWVDASGRTALRRWSVSLPVVVTAPSYEPPSLAEVRPQRWVLDTAYTGQAYAWRSHLMEAGLDPTVGLAGIARSRSAFGAAEHLPIRAATLWLVSNLPSRRAKPFPLPVVAGIAFRDAVAPENESLRPLLGMRVLLRAGVKVQIDCARATVSVWTPGPWYQSLSLELRRLFTGFATVPVRW